MSKFLIKFFVFILLSITIFSPLGFKANAAPKKALNPQEVWEKAIDAYHNYDFEEAEELFDQYKTLKTKAKQPLDEDYEEWTERIQTAINAFDRVQKIVVLDSISVPRQNFYEYYKIASSAGKLVGAESISKEGLPEEEVIFISEGGDHIIAPEKNEDGELRLIEKVSLLDGSVENLSSLAGDFDLEGDYAYPYMEADGQTLYFANNGPGSLGGYDIFVAQKDPISGEYLQPLNLGMPFNSPYDDLMMVIDNETGVGWWATDRNSPDGSITLYIYKLDDLRKNYPSSTENLVDFALISDYKATWEEGQEKEYNYILKNLPEVKPLKKSKPEEFTLALGNGKVYHNFTDFKNKKAEELMRQYIKEKSTLEKKEVELLDLRQRFPREKNLKDKIITLENEIMTLREKENNSFNEILKLEKAVR